MKYSPHTALLLRSQYFNTSIHRAARVNNYWQVMANGYIYLLRKTNHLLVVVAAVPVIVEADLSYRKKLIFFKRVFHSLKFIPIVVTNVARMKSQHRITYTHIRFLQFKHPAKVITVY